jgi:hypothetical protein
VTRVRAEPHLVIIHVWYVRAAYNRQVCIYLIVELAELRHTYNVVYLSLT